MRVLHIINSLTSGGAEKLVVDLLPYFEREGIQIDMLLLTSENDVHSERVPAGIHLFHGYKGKSIYTPLQIIKIGKIIRHYDIVHVHLFPSQYWTALAHMLWGRKEKLVTTEHSTLNTRMKHALFKPIEKLIYSKYSKVISISEGTQYELQNWLGMNSNRFCVIKNGVDLNVFRLSQKYQREEVDAKLTNQNIILIFVARLAEAKDHYTVFKAVSLLPDRYRLLVIGEGSKEEEYKDYCDQNNLNEKVLFMGFRADLPSLLKMADISILSSHWEGFGLAAVEAMAAGIPVIASNVTGLNEIVSGAGILFEKGSETDLVQKIEGLVNNPIQKAKIIKLQLERAKKYDISYTAQKYISLYQSLLTE